MVAVLDISPPQPGQFVLVETSEFIRHQNQLASRELRGEVLAATPKALLIRGHATLRESDWCLRCGLAIDNPISRLVGYGPVCSDKLGIPRPEKLDLRTIDEIRKRVERDTVWEGWLPRSHTTVREVTGTPTPRKPTTAGRVLDHTGSAFILRFPYDPDLVNGVKTAGMNARWLKDFKVWSVPTDQSQRVGAFAVLHNFTITEAAEAVIAGLDSLLEASSASTTDFNVAGLGMTLYPFQRAGVKYAVQQRRIILGDSMGIGKTCQSLATVHHLNAWPAVVVCPASLKLNWQREATRWLPGVDIQILAAGKHDPYRRAQLTIVNYDILTSRLAVLKRLSPKALILDESHYLKSGGAQRTKAALSLARHVRDVQGSEAVVLCLTGTAVLNRPEELASQLDILGRLSEFGGSVGAFKSRYKYAGPSRLQELNRKLRSSCYVRREKAEVLTELPPKVRSVVPMELDNRREYNYARDELISYLRGVAARDQAFLDSIKDLTPEEQEWAKTVRADSAEERALRAETLVRINALKRLVARGKLPSIISWVRDFLTDSDEKLVVFAWHQDIVAALAKEFECDSITGQTSLPLRQHYVDCFQQDADKRVLVLNMQAGGVGITLTAASNVAFVELGWTPALHDQAEDRCHRIGQTDSVTAYYLLGDGTIEEWIANLLDQKRIAVDATLIGSEAEANGSLLAELKSKLLEGV